MKSNLSSIKYCETTIYIIVLFIQNNAIKNLRGQLIVLKYVQIIETIIFHKTHPGAWVIMKD